MPLITNDNTVVPSFSHTQSDTDSLIYLKSSESMDGKIMEGENTPEAALDRMFTDTDFEPPPVYPCA